MHILTLLLVVVLFWSLRSFAGESNQGRIIEGVEVKPKFKYPFMVRIWHPALPNGKNRTQCCGTVLNRDWILTAAHCVTQLGYGLYFTVGDHDTQMKEENEQDLRAKQIIIHEKYRGGSLKNWDIAVVKVEPSIRFSNLVAPINLPSCKQKPSYREVTAIGWGRSEIPLTPALREGNVTIVPLSECRRQGENSSVVRHQLCIRDTNGTHADSGDSGGPIVQLREKGNYHSGYVQVGICNAEAPGKDLIIYADVAAYVGWISRRVSDCGNHPFNEMYFSNRTPGMPTYPIVTKPTTIKPFK